MEATNPSSKQVSMIAAEGTYQGKNLYVQNPYTSSGGFCVTRVMVNEYESTVGIESSAFEIDFQQFQLKIGDAVLVRILHHPGCTPKVLNPEVLKSEA